MLKKIVMSLILTSSLFAENELWKFFKYSTAYASFSLNAPRHQDDRFAIVGGLSTGDLQVARTERDLKPDFQTSFGLRKIGRFKYEPKRGVKNAGVGGTWYDGSEQNANENATLGPVKGWEYLIKFTEGRQWGNEYINQEYWLRYIGDWAVAKVGWTDLGLEEITYGEGDLRFKWTPPILDDKLTVSIGAKHRQHPVYGFDAMILDTTWYRGQWWKFAEKAFGIDDNAWFTEEYYNNGDMTDQDIQLYEIDPETGHVKLEKYTACDDFGRIINPMVVEGQVHGGLAQGIGQALYENAEYDETGQLMTGSYMDYTMPRADNFPEFNIGYTCTHATTNPLGVKGCGEAGAIAAPPTVMNAVIDALGGQEVTMPATAEKVWKACKNLKKSNAKAA